MDGEKESVNAGFDCGNPSFDRVCQKRITVRYTQWSLWSTWQSTSVAQSDTVDVETKTIQRPIVVTNYA